MELEGMGFGRETELWKNLNLCIYYFLFFSLSPSSLSQFLLDIYFLEPPHELPPTTHTHTAI